jgi:hypothetical protein
MTTVQHVLALAGPEFKSISDLHAAYMLPGNRFFPNPNWSYLNPRLNINRIKEALEERDPSSLSREDNEKCGEILWCWYHQASLNACLSGDKRSARIFAAKALLIQGRRKAELPRLLYYLLNHRFREALGFAATMSGLERETGDLLIGEYCQGAFLF